MCAVLPSSSTRGRADSTRDLVLHYVHVCAWMGSYTYVRHEQRLMLLGTGQDSQELVCIPIVHTRRVGGFSLPWRHVTKAFPLSFVSSFCHCVRCISTHSIPERSIMPSTERERKKAKVDRKGGSAEWRNIEFLVLVVCLLACLACVCARPISVVCLIVHGPARHFWQVDHL